MSRSVADNELRILEQMEVYRQILDAIADMVLVKGEGSRILWANRAFCEYYAMTTEQLRSLVDATFNETDYTAQYIRDDLEVYTTGEVLNIPEEPVTRHDGLVQVFHTVKSPLRAPDGKIVMTVGVSRNITEQKRTKEDLARYRERLERLVEERTLEYSRLSSSLSTILSSLIEGIIAIDGEGRINIANPAAERFLGVPTADMESQVLWELLEFEPEGSNGQERFEPAQLLKSSRPTPGTLRARTGERRLVSIHAVPLKRLEPAPGGSVLVMRDLALEREVADQRLRQQKLESLGVLAGGIAHDFNNLLAGILGSVSMARFDLAHGKSVDELLEQAERACLRARGLTTQLLTFSRGGAPVKKVIQLLPTLREAAELALSGSSCKFVMTSAPDVAPVAADEGQIAQVINNLVINAKQAMPSGGQVTIHVGSTTISSDDHGPLPPGKYVRISVRDQGVGIAAEHLDRIFDPYFTTKPSGSGLGLASVHSIVKQHGGHVHVTSKLHSGTQFEVYLPAAEAEPGNVTARLKSDVSRTGLRVLVLDDDLGVRKVMKAMLSLLGHEVVVVGRSADALAAFDEHLAAGTPFDAAFVDLTMPGDLPGKDVIGMLRERSAQTKLIVMSGYSTDPVMADYQSHGLAARLQKPFTLANVREVL